MQYRYIIAYGWSHFIEEGGEMAQRLIRWVFDTNENKISHLEINRDRAWGAASEADFANVEDHIKNANPEVLERPEVWGLESHNDLPDWAGGPAAQPGLR